MTTPFYWSLDSFFSLFILTLQEERAPRARRKGTALVLLRRVKAGRPIDARQRIVKEQQQRGKADSQRHGKTEMKLALLNTTVRQLTQPHLEAKLPTPHGRC